MPRVVVTDPDDPSREPVVMNAAVARFRPSDKAFEIFADGASTSSLYSCPHAIVCPGSTRARAPVERITWRPCSSATV